MKTHLLALALLVGTCLSLPMRAQRYTPTEENLKSRQEFRDARFGIFLHWGLYAMLATGEWTMTNNNLNYKEYAKLAGGFYPSPPSRLREPSTSASRPVITKASPCSIRNTLTTM